VPNKIKKWRSVVIELFENDDFQKRRDIEKVTRFRGGEMDSTI